MTLQPCQSSCGQNIWQLWQQWFNRW